MLSVRLARLHPSAASLYSKLGWWDSEPADPDEDTYGLLLDGAWTSETVEQVARGAADAGYQYSSDIEDEGDVVLILGAEGDAILVIAQQYERGLQVEAQIPPSASLSSTVRQLLRKLERSDDAAVSIAIELFVTDALRDLEDENSELRRALEEARIDAAFLRGQLHALSEAKAIGRKPVTKAVLGVVAAVLMAATTGVTGGAAQAVVENRLSRNDAPPSVAVYIERCEAIQVQIGD